MYLFYSYNLGSFLTLVYADGCACESVQYKRKILLISEMPPVWESSRYYIDIPFFCEVLLL